MLPDSITLSIDEDNDGANPVSHVLSRAEESANKSTYNDAAHTVASRKQCSFLRTFPKQAGNFYGTLRTSVKFTDDITVVGVNGENIKVPIIAEAAFSFPVGTTNAQATLMRQKLVSICDYDTVMDPFHDQGMI